MHTYLFRWRLNRWNKYANIGSVANHRNMDLMDDQIAKSAAVEQPHYVVAEAGVLGVARPDPAAYAQVGVDRHHRREVVLVSTWTRSLVLDWLQNA